MNFRAVLVLLIAILAGSGLLSATDRYAATAARAQRSFDGHEWASAAALYELMLDMQPDSADIYARAIVANDMAGDTVASVDLLERATTHGIGFAKMLQQVRSVDFAIGSGDRYGTYLLRLRNQFPWMSRALDHELLNHYTFRRDGPMMVHYANEMLAGMPDSVEYLTLLADGYLVSGDYDHAETTWLAILAIEPHNYDALLHLGNYYADTDAPAKALEYLVKAQADRPTPYLAERISLLNNQIHEPHNLK